jgi:hypothetical protein
MVSNFCGKLKVLAELCCYHNLFCFIARLCSSGYLQLIFMVVIVSPLNWDFLGCPELIIKVSLARIPFIGTSPGCMALVSIIKAKVISQLTFLFFFGDFLMSSGI